MRESTAAIASRWFVARDLERITESEPMPRRAGSLDDRPDSIPSWRNGMGVCSLESVQAHSPLPCAYHGSVHHTAHDERMAKRDCPAMNLDSLTAALSPTQSSGQKLQLRALCFWIFAGF